MSVENNGKGEITVGELYSSSTLGGKAIDTGWSNAPKLADLKKDKETAKNHHESNVTKIKEWLDALHTKGKYGMPKEAGKSAVTPKLIRRLIEWKAPSLSEPFLNTKKLIEATPRTWDDGDSAAQNEVILNYQLKNKINLVALMGDITRCIETEGTAVLKPSWLHKSSLVKREEKKFGYQDAPELAEQYQAIMAQLEQQPDLINEISEEMEEGLRYFAATGEARAYYVEEVVTIETEKTIVNHPDVTVCDNLKVYPDPSCKSDIKKCRYIVHDYEVTFADLEQAGIYENLDEVKRHVQSKETDNRSSNADSSRKIFEVSEYWGYWDINNDGILSAIVATWVDDILIQLELSPYESGKLPFIFIKLNDLNKDSLYGEAEAELIGEQQQILGAILRGTIDMMGKSAAGQRGTAKNFLDPTNKKKFEQGKDYEYNFGGDPSKDIYDHTWPQLPNSVMPLLQYANNEADSMAGVQAWSQGINSGSLGTVAAGMKNAISAAAKRETGILRRIAQGLVELSYFFVEMNNMFLTEQDVVRLTSKEFAQVDPENLSGDFDLILDIASSETDAANIQNLTMLLQVGQTVLPFEYTKKILISIARIARLYDLEQFLIEYEPEPDPIQQQKDQIEIERLRLENEEKRADIALKLAEAAVKQAEVNVRDARAENLSSNTDKNSVQTLKEINGTNQKEKMELQDQQHLNNIDSKRFDHNAGLRTGLANASLNTGQQQQNN